MNKKFLTLCVSSLCLLNSNAFAENIYKNTKTQIQSNINKEVNQAAEDNGLTLENILSKNIHAVSEPKLSNAQTMRLNKLKQVAFEYGANVGRAEQARLHEKEAEKMSAMLDRDYDFSRLLIHQNPPVLPPIISTGVNNFQSLDEKTMQVSKRMFKIEVPAQIVSVVPTWRDYLKLGYSVTKHPTNGFRPKNKLENQVWDKAVTEGYAHGKKAADLDWDNAVGELRRDYSSMLNYKIALANGMINPAIIQIENMGDVVDENGNVLRNNEMMVKIINDAYFSKQKNNMNRATNPNPSVTKLPNGKNMK